ncbi:MAG: hypothetical protein ABW157_12480 [Candidatus Thiodiazotropha sp. LLP2]
MCFSTASLQEERDQLAKEKTDLEQREQLLSMGFHASLTTTLIAGLGLFVRLPNSKLERQLKQLEIEQKELELERLRSGTET